jgi:octaprenyl-diphosphate synthase
MDISQVYGLVQDDLKKVEEEFDRNLASDVPLIPQVGRYILGSGGKRIRPLLLLLSARLAGYRGERTIPLAAIMEFIHTATLLHDDVVDNADLRRGRQAARAVWGNSASVLVGDFLFSKSFSLMTSHGDMRILAAVSKATTHMAEGEVLQLTKVCDIGITEEEYLEVVTNKTAVLIAAACEVGGLLGNLSEEKVAALRRFGLELGTAFQLTDDCLDYIADEEEFGKAVGSDLAEGKITLPMLHTIGKCAKDERGRLADIICKEEPDGDDLAFVMGLIGKYGGIAVTRERALARVNAAKASLAVFEPSSDRAALEEVADFVVTRRL